MKVCFNVEDLMKELTVLKNRLNEYLGKSIVYLERDKNYLREGVNMKFKGFPAELHFSVHQPTVSYTDGISCGYCTPEEFDFNEEMELLGAEINTGASDIVFGIDMYAMKRSL